MTLWLKALATTLISPVQSPQPMWLKERIDSYMLSSDLHMHARAHMSHT